MDCPTVGSLLCVWGTSATNVYAAGASLLHFDGESWCEVETPQLEGLWVSLWGRENDDIYLASGAGQLLHFDGAKWSEEFRVEGICQIWGRGDTVWVVGGDFDEGGEIYVREGREPWRPEEIEAYPLDDDEDEDDARFPYTVGIAGPDSGPVYAIAWEGGEVLERDAATGTWRFATNGGPILNALWCHDSNSVFGAGDSSHAVKFDGQGWAPLREHADHRYRHVVISPDGTIYATDGTAIYRSGTPWTQLVKLGPDDGGIDDFWVGDNSEVFAVGACFGKGFILHFDGDRWNRTPMTRPMTAIAGASRDALYAAGFDGLLLYKDDNWTSVQGEVGSRLSFDEEGRLWALSRGSDGIMRFGHDSPETFLVSPSALASGSIALFDLHAFGAKDVIAVGSDGVVARWDGKSWNLAKVGDDSLYCVWARSAEDIYVGGGNGTAYHWNGKDWRDLEFDGNSTFFHIDGDDKDAWFAAAGELLCYRA